MGRLDEYTRRVLRRDPHGLYPQGLPPRRRGAFSRRAMCPPTAISTSSRRRSARSASRSSGWMPAASPMARLLAYLFEVTERFGMETPPDRADLAPAHHGGGRGRGPIAGPRDQNIWTVARPVVEDYIKENIGPKASGARPLSHRAGPGPVRAAPAGTGRTRALGTGQPAAARAPLALARTDRDRPCRDRGGAWGGGPSGLALTALRRPGREAQNIPRGDRHAVLHGQPDLPPTSAALLDVP